jgi:hypothetical protein
MKEINLKHTKEEFIDFAEDLYKRQDNSDPKIGLKIINILKRSEIKAFIKFELDIDFSGLIFHDMIVMARILGDAFEREKEKEINAALGLK